MTFDGTDDPDGIWTSDPAPAGPRRPPRRGPDAPRPHAPPPAGAVPPQAPAPPPRRRREPEVDDDGYFDLPPEGRVPRWIVALGVVVLVLGLLVGGTVWWYHRQVDPPGAPGAVVSVVVPEGSSTSKIASILDDRGVITNATLFGFWSGSKDLGDVQAGTYRFRQGSSFQEAVDVLEAGPTTPAAKATTKVTIPEGYTVRQIVDRIAQKVPRLKQADLQAALDQGKVPSSLKPAGSNDYEGLLFPATYEVGEDDDAVTVLSRMAAEMDSRVSALGIDEARAHIKQRWGLDLTPYEILKVASMIQYEAAVPEDAPKIGAVTYNRLQKGMPLQYDSTSIYEAGLQGKGPDQVDYTADSPYNTRTRTGLPPTPIAAPGEYALQGAFEPADGPWLYFVLTDPKVVSFTDDYQEFLGFKAECARKGLGCG